VISTATSTIARGARWLASHDFSRCTPHPFGSPSVLRSAVLQASHAFPDLRSDRCRPRAGSRAGSRHLGCSSSTSKADGCAPTSSVTAGGTLSIERASADKSSTAVTVYTLSQVQAEELFSSGLLTMMAGDADGAPARSTRTTRSRS